MRTTTVLRTRPIRAVAVALLVPALLLAACGGDDDTVSAGSPAGDETAGGDDAADPGDGSGAAGIMPADEDPATGDANPDAPVSGGGGTDDISGPERVEPQAGMADVRPVVFDPAEADATDGGVLVRFWGGVAPCSVLDSVTVVESADSVMITLMAGSDPAQPDAVCIEIAKQYEVLVPLDAPLGDRQLIDGVAAL